MTIKLASMTSCLLGLFILGSLADDALAVEACPGKANAHVVSRTETMRGDTLVRSTKCQCDDGYAPQGTACVKETFMRPLTRQDCFRSAGRQLQEDMAHCKAPIAGCMVDAGFAKEDAECLVAAMALANGVSMPVAEAVSYACGNAAIGKVAAVIQCRQKWKDDVCFTQKMADHADSIRECRAMK
jgi:hypothetical protein